MDKSGHVAFSCVRFDNSTDRESLAIMSFRTDVRSHTFNMPGTGVDRFVDTSSGATSFALTGGGIFSEFCVTNDFAWVFFFFHFLRTHPVVWRSQKTVKIGLFLFIRLFDYIKTCYKHAVYCTDDGKNTDFFFLALTRIEFRQNERCLTWWFFSFCLGTSLIRVRSTRKAGEKPM